MDRTNEGAPPRVSGQTMDRVVPRRGRRWRRIALAAGLLGAGLAGFALFWPGTERTLAVAHGRVELGRVVRGRFDDFVPIRARAVPARTTFLDTAQGGQVQAIHVEDGAVVAPGQLLVELTNTVLQLDVISREAQITEQLNNLRTLELAHEQNRLAHRREMVEVDHHIALLGQKLGRNEKLVGSGVVPRGEQEDTAEELRYYRQRRAVQLDSFAAANQLQKQQLVQLRAAAIQLNENLGVARRNLDGLRVVAPIAGKLSAFSLEVGQSLAPGERIGQVDDPEQFKLTAEIDEFYLSRVDVGQRAEYVVDGQTYWLKVTKIRPQVQDSRFGADLHFEGASPAQMRRGQAAQLKLQLGQPTDATLIPFGAFYADTGGAWVFVVSDDGRYAARRAVRLGRRNPQSIEVLDGLRPGESIVTSAYTNYLDTDRLELTR